MTNSSMKVMTTDWLTASPTPFGPPPAFSPLYDATRAAISAEDQRLDLTDVQVRQLRDAR